MKNRFKVLLVLVVAGLCLGVFFQNCGEVNFSSIPSDNSKTGNNLPPNGLTPTLDPGVTGVPTNTPVPTVFDTPTPTMSMPSDTPTPTMPMPTSIATPTPTVVTCPPGYIEKDGVCLPIKTKFTECERFEDLAGLRIIPTLEDTGTCYYLKIVDQMSNAPSGSRGETWVNDVVARRHTHIGDKRPNSKLYGTNDTSTYPYVLGDSGVLDLDFAGPRKISFTSSAVADETQINANGMFVDNFLFMQVKDNGIDRYIARGTLDSPISSTRPIAYLPNGNSAAKIDVLDFTGKAPGGTEKVGVIHLLPTVGTDFTGLVNLRVRMLDCGGSAETSDVYLIIH